MAKENNALKATLKELTDFIQKHNCLPTRSNRTSSEMKLAELRYHYVSLYNRNLLNKEAMKAVESSGILSFDKWAYALAKVTDFVRQQGRLPTKYNSHDSERKLAHWRNQNVSLYNRGLLSPERTELLEASGILYNEDDKIWSDRLEQVKEFVKLNKRYPSRFAKSEEEKTIGRWRSEQAVFFRKNILPPNRQQLFEQAGLSTFIIDKQWNDTLKQVVQFKKKYGRMPLPDGIEVGEKHLASWCRRNHLALIKVTTPRNQQRAKRFNAAGIPASQSKSDPWEVQYQKLIAFCKKHSHLPLHGTIGPEKNLYQWYFDQLTKIKKMKLDNDKVDRIKAIKNTMASPGKIAREKKWMDQYRKVSDFVNEHKRLPSSYPKNVAECTLYCWLQQQKKAVKKDVLELKYMRLLKNCIGNDKLLEWKTS